VRFARPNRVPEFEPRPFIARKDAATLARDLLALTPDEFSTAFKGSPMKRAKLRGLQRNAAVVLTTSAGRGQARLLDDAACYAYWIWMYSGTGWSRRMSPRGVGGRSFLTFVNCFHPVNCTGSRLMSRQ
jgi:hypothetical protein